MELSNVNLELLMCTAHKTTKILGAPDKRDKVIKVLKAPDINKNRAISLLGLHTIEQ